MNWLPITVVDGNKHSVVFSFAKIQLKFVIHLDGNLAIHINDLKKKTLHLLNDDKTEMRENKTNTIYLFPAGHGQLS